jgi:hypothetical protein
MWILVLALIMIFWLVLRRSGGNAAVAASALTSLREADALAVNAWRKLEALIAATPDPDLTCAQVVAMRKTELPAAIVELWQYIDDVTERSNHRAEHYESVAREPAPPLQGRAVSEAIMAGIRSRAARVQGRGA